MFITNIIAVAVCAQPTMPKVSPTFLYALAKVEKADPNQPDGKDGEAGPFQIRNIYRRDVNRICNLLGINDHFTREDCLSWQRSAKMTRIYLEFWGRHWVRKGYKLNYADLCAMHRWGGPAWRPWSKSKLKIDRGRTAKLKYYMKSYELL